MKPNSSGDSFKLNKVDESEPFCGKFMTVDILQEKMAKFWRDEKRKKDILRNFSRTRCFRSERAHGLGSAEFRHKVDKNLAMRVFNL